VSREKSDLSRDRSDGDLVLLADVRRRQGFRLRILACDYAGDGSNAMNKLKHFLAFTNPRTKTREVIWFATKRSRDAFRADLQQDFGCIATEEWQEKQATGAAK
jgi:predicted Mrr-cat superfamily restriction endonuclease